MFFAHLPATGKVFGLDKGIRLARQGQGLSARFFGAIAALSSPQTAPFRAHNNRQSYNQPAMIRHALLLLAGFLLLALCLPEAHIQAQPLRVALLLEGSQDDHAKNSLMRLGLANAAKQGNLQASVLEADKENLEAAFAKAAKEHDLVLLASPRLHEILRSQAGNYPRTSFGCLDTSVLGLRSKNIMSVTFSDAEPAFLAGAAAALMVEKGQKLGWLEDEESPQSRTMLEGFIAGAQISRPDIRIVRREALGKDMGTLLSEMRKEGAAMVFLATGPHTRDAVAALATQPLWGVGLDMDQSSLAPQKIPFSLVKRFDKAVEELVLAKANGTFKGRETLVYNLQNKGVALVLARDTRLPANVNRRLKELSHELEAGNIVLQDKRTPTLCNCLD